MVVKVNAGCSSCAGISVGGFIGTAAFGRLNQAVEVAIQHFTLQPMLSLHAEMGLNIYKSAMTHVTFKVFGALLLHTFALLSLRLNSLALLSNALITSSLTLSANIALTAL